MNPSMAVDQVGVHALEFKSVTDYTTFRAEYSWDGDDLVLHFFRTPEKEGDHNFWLQVFPTALDVAARQYFEAVAPRLRAAFTEEMDSWWMKAKDYGHIIAKDEYVTRFLEKLDQMLDTMSST